MVIDSLNITQTCEVKQCRVSKQKDADNINDPVITWKIVLLYEIYSTVADNASN